MKFLIVSSMVPRIFVAGLLLLVYEMVESLVGMVVHQLIFQFVVEISDFIYASIVI